MPIQFPDEPRIADGCFVAGVEHAPRHERRALAAHRDRGASRSDRQTRGCGSRADRNGASRAHRRSRVSSARWLREPRGEIGPPVSACVAPAKNRCGAMSRRIRSASIGIRKFRARACAAALRDARVARSARRARATSTPPASRDRPAPRTACRGSGAGRRGRGARHASQAAAAAARAGRGRRCSLRTLTLSDAASAPAGAAVRAVAIEESAAPHLEGQRRPELQVQIAAAVRSAGAAVSTKRVSRMPRWRQVSDSSTSRAKPASSPRNQRAIGTAKPCFCRSMIESGSTPRIACLNRYFVVPPLQAEPRRNRRRELHQLVVEQRRPRLQRMRHRHPIDLGEDVEREVVMEVAILDRRRASRRRPADAGPHSASAPADRAATDLLERLPLEQARHLVGVEQRLGVEIAFRPVEREMPQESAPLHAVRHQGARPRRRSS